MRERGGESEREGERVRESERERERDRERERALSETGVHQPITQASCSSVAQSQAPPLWAGRAAVCTLLRWAGSVPPNTQSTALWSPHMQPFSSFYSERANTYGSACILGLYKKEKNIVL